MCVCVCVCVYCTFYDSYKQRYKVNQLIRYIDRVVIINKLSDTYGRVQIRSRVWSNVVMNQEFVKNDQAMVLV